MATKPATPVITITDSELAALYQRMAWNKAHVDRSKAAVLAAERSLVETLTPGRQITDPAQPRYVELTRVPAGERRKARPKAREQLIKLNPMLAARCVTTVIPTRRCAATFVAGAGWDAFTTAQPAISLPTYNPAAPWPLVDFIAMGKAAITEAGKAGDALRDELDELLDRLTLRPAGTVLHEIGRGQRYRIAPTKVTHRLNTATLKDVDPAMYLALTTPEAVPEHLALKIAKVEADPFDLSIDL